MKNFELSKNKHKLNPIRDLCLFLDVNNTLVLTLSEPEPCCVILYMVCVLFISVSYFYFNRLKLIACSTTRPLAVSCRLPDELLGTAVRMKLTVFAL